jgi:hypothetical protein
MVTPPLAVIGQLTGAARGGGDTVGFEPTACCLRNSGTHVHQRPPTSMVAEFIAFESSWLFASVHGCSPRVAVNEVLSIACAHIRGHVLQLMASALRYAQPSARACVLIFRKACLALV